MFDLQVTPIFPTKFQVNWPAVQWKKFKIDFQDGGRGGHLGFPSKRFYFFYLQVVLILPSRFRVSWSFGSGEEVQNIYFKMATMVTILDFRS